MTHTYGVASFGEESLQRVSRLIQHFHANSTSRQSRTWMPWRLHGSVFGGSTRRR